MPILRGHMRIAAQEIHRAAGAPGPGTQRAPIIHLARLALVHQADDALGQACAVVGLDAAGIEDGIAPSQRQDLRPPVRACGLMRTASAGGTVAD